MGPAELIGLVRDLLGEVGRLRAANEALQGEAARLKSENQTLKDEIARLKHLPPRPPLKPSGMEKATEPSKPEADKAARRRRGPGVSKLTIDRTVELTVEAPAGSRRKGYEDIVVQDLMLRTETTLYRRERWETPDGRQIVAPLLAGIVGGYGPQLRRLILMLHVQGQMTFERIVTLLTGQALDPLLRQIGQTDSPLAVAALAQAVQALPAKLSEAQTSQALGPLLRQIGQTHNPWALTALAGALRALPPEAERSAGERCARPTAAADRPNNRFRGAQRAGGGAPGFAGEAD